jgi:hypothetical protein
MPLRHQPRRPLAPEVIGFHLATLAAEAAMSGSADPAKGRTLKEDLARFMDPTAFKASVPQSVKFTAKEYGRAVHDKLKVRRTIAMKRAEAAIRFFSKPEERERLDHRLRAAPFGKDWSGPIVPGAGEED